MTCNCDLKWNLLVVYGASKEDKKLSFLTELSHFCASNTEPMMIGGDFNIIRYLNEKILWMGYMGVPQFSIL